MCSGVVSVAATDLTQEKDWLGRDVQAFDWPGLRDYIRQSATTASEGGSGVGVVWEREINTFWKPSSATLVMLVAPASAECKSWGSRQPPTHFLNLSLFNPFKASTPRDLNLAYLLAWREDDANLSDAVFFDKAFSHQKHGSCLACREMMPSCMQPFFISFFR